MPGKNIHKEPFDDGTLLKLDIFQKYLKEWLPVFLNWAFGTVQINIVDFFAGQGKDVNGIPGSPILIIQEILAHKSEIEIKKVKIRVIVNELNKDKYKMLDSEITPFKESFFELIVENEPFEKCFHKHFDKLADPNAANYIFLDQNGIKEITEGIFAKLIALKRTDILFFISSSYLKRFKGMPEFKKYLDTDRIPFDESNHHSCHRAVFDFYKAQIPGDKEYYLAPFSLKKGRNIYGLIFGSNHTYGIEKFLKICWNLDRQRGDSNYDIDSDRIDTNAPSLFKEFNIPKKVQVFENEMKNYTLKEEKQSLRNIYRFGLDKGFQPKHVNKILKELKDNGKIDFDSKLTSDKIHKLDFSLEIKRL